MDLVMKKVGLRRYKLLLLLATYSLTCIARMPLMTLEKNLVAVCLTERPASQTLGNNHLQKLLDQSNLVAHKEATTAQGAFL